MSVEKNQPAKMQLRALFRGSMAAWCVSILVLIAVSRGVIGFQAARLLVKGGVFVWCLGIVLVTAISSAIIGMRMRREIKRDLGRDATDADLTSIETWIEVEDAERSNQLKKP